eukprot:3332553-Pleurochrysis_carterae.AAC.2
MASSALAAATTFANLRPLDRSNPFATFRKMQLQFDGMSWTRGHGCTRLIVRLPDLLRELNSPLFSRDVIFSLGPDKLKDFHATPCKLLSRRRKLHQVRPEERNDLPPKLRRAHAINVQISLR